MMNEADRFVHIYRSGDNQFTIPVMRLKDSYEAETTPVYINPSGNIAELSHHIEMAYTNSGLATSDVVNPWHTPEGESLYFADIFCEVAWGSTGVYLSPYELVIDEEEDERGWAEDTASLIGLGQSPSFHNIAVAVSEYFEKGGNGGKPALADQTPVTRPTDATTGYQGDLG